MVLAGDGRSSFDGGFDGTEAGGVTHDLDSLTHAISRRSASDDVERDDAAEARQILRCDVMRRV
jgi:hypothetical protein